MTQETHTFLVKTILTGEDGDQNTDRRLYKVIRGKTPQTFKKELLDYLCVKYPRCLFSVNIYDCEKPIPAGVFPEDEEIELFCFPW